jgi:DNA-binding transcriptional regulator YdaS (Cro superfamily)
MCKQTLKKAVDLAGGQSALATGIRIRMPGSKVSQAHISKWLLRSKSEVPPGDYVVAIADTVGYQVTPHELRRDLYPNASDALPSYEVV